MAPWPSTSAAYGYSYNVVIIYAYGMYVQYVRS